MEKQKNDYTEAVVQNIEDKHTYYKGQVMQRKTDTSLLDYLNDNYQEGDSVLDYGGGSGRLLEIMINKDMPAALEDYKYYDNAPAAIAKFKEKFSDYEDSVETELKKQYDYVIANDILTQSENLDQFKAKLEELVKLANKGCLLHFWISKNKKSIHQITKNQGIEFDNFWISKVDLLSVLGLSTDQEITYHSEEDFFSAMNKGDDHPDIFEWRFYYDDNGRPWKTCFLAITKKNKTLNSEAPKEPEEDENEETIFFNTESELRL